MRTSGNIAGLGPIIQLAFVPRDFEGALRFWTGTIGAGPFYLLDHIALTDTRYRGQTITIDQSAALGYWGEMQIELIVQHDDGPSIYREFLDKGGEGLQHIGVHIADMGAAARLVEAKGGIRVHEATVPGAAQAIYYELPGPGPTVELIYLAEKFDALFSLIRRSADGWDGCDPLRPLPPEGEWW